MTAPHIASSRLSLLPAVVVALLATTIIVVRITGEQSRTVVM